MTDKPELALTDVGNVLPKYDAKADMEKFGLAATEQIEVTNEVTGDKSIVVLDRTGATNEKVCKALANTDIPQEQKNALVSMYLWEHGAHSMSMMADLIQYKGKHSKESRAFNSMMRSDFTLFLGTYMESMQSIADEIERNIKAGDTPAEVLQGLTKALRDSAELMQKRIQAEAEKRDHERGKGIYIDLDGAVRDVYEDPDGVVEAVTKDAQEAKESV
jgi:hypothetical protein